jgi:hypothetical protein
MGFHEDMARLQKHFKLLEREYEQWFSGALPKPPWETQRIVEDIVKKYSRNPPRNITEQSIFSMHQAKVNTYMEMWNRRVRLKEEGRLPGGREERQKRVAPASRAAGSGAGEDGYRKVFENYVAAKQKTGEATGKLNYENFKKALEKQASQLRAKRGFDDVNFGVSVKNGKVSVVARPKKS